MTAVGEYLMHFSDDEIDRLADRLVPRMTKLLGAAAGKRDGGLCGQAEALEILGISRSSLYRLVDQGVITRRKFGRHNRFDREQLRSVVDDMRFGRVRP